MAIHPDIEKVLVTEDQLRERNAQLGAAISADYADKDLLVIGVLKGAAWFLSDLTRNLSCDFTVDYMAVSSYGAAHKSSGVVRIMKDLEVPLEGRHVLIAEDILDTGLTLKYLVRNFLGRGAASVEIAACVLKEGAQEEAIDLRYVGFVLANEFVVGYGLDYAQRYRGLPYIGRLRSSVYQNA
ncbi:MAG: hypoxanthine phosphoribosyltransferase [Coriobacteriia bacterium]|nr:hypoxanthine phosphoribosyltransferase [Coriobacteriia bacterium]